MLDLVLVASGALAILVAASLRHLERLSISPPLLGLVAGVLLGPQVLDVLSIAPEEEAAVMQVAARLLLAVALMAIALRYPIAAARAVARRVAVLVLVVLPAMAAVLAAGAVWALGLPLGVALVLGAALSPTDPVLASGIVTGEPAERDIPALDRQVLSLESGANDGLAMPLVILAIAWALDRPLPAALGMAAYEVAGGVLYGLLAGALAGRALRWAKSHRELGESVRSLYTLVLAALALGVSGILHADGLLSVFVAGLVHNRVVSGTDRQVEVGVDEALNHFLVVPVFLLLGSVLPWGEWAALGWGGVAFALVALLLRRLPILLLLRRPLRVPWTDAAWLGWFGPIGVAALLYLGHAEEQGIMHPTVWSAGTLVIAVSTVVHGLTAGPSRVAQRRRDVTPT